MATTAPPGSATTPAAGLARLARAWRRERRRVLERPDPEVIHRFRTVTRRLRIAEEIAADHLGLVSRVSWKEWGRVRRRLSRLRDLDVTRQELATTGAGLPPAAEAEFEALFRRLDRRRARSAERVERALGAGPARRVARAVRGLRDRSDRAAPPLRLEADRWWSAAAGRLAADPAWSLARSSGVRGGEEQEDLHRLRVRSRALRYGLEWWNRLGVPAAPDAISFGRDVQDHLGRLRDLRRTIAVAAGRRLLPVRARLREALRTELARWPEVAARRRILGSSPFTTALP